MVTSAEQAARNKGDATEGQRNDLKALLRTRRHTNEWRAALFDDARDGGLTAARARSAINYLRKQPDFGEYPVYATQDLGDRIRELIRTRIAPTPWATSILTRLDDGTLTYEDAGHALADLDRLPKRVFVAPPPGAGSDVPAGYFALNGTDGRVRCYRVRIKGLTRAVDQIDGRGKRRRVPSYQVGSVLAAIGGDVAAGRRLYGHTTKHCSECNRPLHDTENNPGYPFGYGPDCWAARLAAEAASKQAAPPVELEHPDEESA